MSSRVAARSGMAVLLVLTQEKAIRHQDSKTGPSAHKNPRVALLQIDLIWLIRPTNWKVD